MRGVFGVAQSVIDGNFSRGLLGPARSLMADRDARVNRSRTLISRPRDAAASTLSATCLVIHAANIYTSSSLRTSPPRYVSTSVPSNT